MKRDFFKVITQKYHLKNSTTPKQAVLITLLQPVTEEVMPTLYKQLAILLKRQYDSYIFVLKEAALLTACTLKLLLAFRNSYTGPVGLLINEALQKIATWTKLDTSFTIGKQTAPLILKIEACRNNTGE